MQRVLDSPEIERLPSAALDSEWTQAAIKSALASDGAKQLVASLFESGLFDEILDRLVESDGLWRLVDELISSPEVMAAITQQRLRVRRPGRRRCAGAVPDGRRLARTPGAPTELLALQVP